jgi:hypothetical protein
MPYADYSSSHTASIYPFMAASDKKRYFEPGLPLFSGVGQARFINSVDRDDLTMARSLRNPVCTPAGGRFAQIELLYFKGSYPGCVWVAFSWPYQWENCDSGVFVHPQDC